MRLHPLLPALLSAFLLSAAAPAAAQMAQGQAAISVLVSEPEAPIDAAHLTTLEVDVTLTTDLITATAERHAQVELRVADKPDWLTAVLSPAVLQLVAEPRPGEPSVEWTGRATLVLLADQGGAPGDLGELAIEARLVPKGFLPGATQTARVEVERGEDACDGASAQTLSAQSAEPEARVPAPALAVPLAAAAAALVLARRAQKR